jgi:hypothetical protein
LQAEQSNDCWPFNLSPSGLKHPPSPIWIEDGREPPAMMLFRVVDDPGGGGFAKNAAPARRILFNATAPKAESRLVLQRIPKMIYSDNGPVTISRMYENVAARLNANVRGHMQKDSDDWVKDIAPRGVAKCSWE